MNHIIVSNTQGRQVKVYPENVKNFNKADFLEKFSKHFAYPEEVYNGCKEFIIEKAKAKAKAEAEAKANEAKKAEEKKALKKAEEKKA